jgi:hypothetical protein
MPLGHMDVSQPSRAVGHAGAAISGASTGASLGSFLGPYGQAAGAALGGASALGGSIVSGWSQQVTNKANIAEARRAEDVQQANLDRLYKEQAASARQKMEFEERMSNTAVQRRMEDLRKAGINPILAYQQGGATTPPGAQIQGSTSQGVRANIQNVLAPAMSTGLQIMRSAAELQQIQAQTEYMRANTGRVKQASTFQVFDQALELGKYLMGFRRI